MTVSTLPDLVANDTLPKLLALHAREHGGDIAMREKDFGIWRTFTWSQIHARVRAFALGLTKLGVVPGEVVGLLGDNRPDWVMGEIATHAVRGYSLGIYRDALDEVHHTRLCYGIAHAFDGQAIGPGHFPEAVWPADRPTTHASVAAECAVESCLLEAASAHVAHARAQNRQVAAPVREALARIARDEATHARHGFSILEWCLAQRGDEVRNAILRALESFDASVSVGIGSRSMPTNDCQTA